MKDNPTNVVRRFFALLLILALILPNPAFALRDQSLLEKKASVVAGLEEALLSGNPDRFFQAAVGVAGMEEAGAKASKTHVRSSFRGWVAAAVLLGLFTTAFLYVLPQRDGQQPIVEQPPAAIPNQIGPIHGDPQQPPVQPKSAVGALAPLREALGPNRRLAIITWDPRDLLKIRDFSSLAVRTGIDTNWISGFRFRSLTQAQQQQIVTDASDAGLTTLGFIDGNHDWAEARARQFVVDHYNDLIAKVSGLNLGNLRIAFATDIEPYTQKGWTGDLKSYIDLHEEVILPKVQAFAQQKRHPNGKSVVQGPALTLFQPWWLVNGRKTDSGAVVKNLRPIKGALVAIASMSYRDNANAVAETARIGLGRAIQEGAMLEFGVETLPEKEAGTPSFADKPSQIGPALHGAFKVLGEDQKYLAGVYIHTQRPGTARLILQEIERTPPPAPPKPAQAAAEFGVKDGKAKLSRLEIELELLLPKEMLGKKLVAVPAIFIRQDQWYLQPFEDQRAIFAIGVDGRVTLKTVDRPSAFQGGATVRRAIMILEQGKAKEFLEIYKKSGIHAAGKLALKVIFIGEDGKTQVVESLSRGGLEEAERLAEAIIREFYDRVGVQGAKFQQLPLIFLDGPGSRTFSRDVLDHLRDQLIAFWQYRMGGAGDMEAEAFEVTWQPDLSGGSFGSREQLDGFIERETLIGGAKLAIVVTDRIGDRAALLLREISEKEGTQLVIATTERGVFRQLRDHEELRQANVFPIDSSRLFSGGSAVVGAQEVGDRLFDWVADLSIQHHRAVELVINPGPAQREVKARWYESAKSQRGFLDQVLPMLAEMKVNGGRWNVVVNEASAQSAGLLRLTVSLSPAAGLEESLDARWAGIASQEKTLDTVVEWLKSLSWREPFSTTSITVEVSSARSNARGLYRKQRQVALILRDPTSKAPQPVLRVDKQISTPQELVRQIATAVATSGYYKDPEGRRMTDDVLEQVEANLRIELARVLEREFPPLQIAAGMEEKEGDPAEKKRRGAKGPHPYREIQEGKARPPVAGHQPATSKPTNELYAETKNLILQHPEWNVKTPNELADLLGVRLDDLLHEMSNAEIVGRMDRLLPAASAAPSLAPGSLTVVSPPGRVVAEVTTGVVSPTAVAGQGASQDRRREAVEQVRAIFQGITPITQSMAGIGPTQARSHADALRVIVPLMPAALRQQVFVVASNAAQGEELAVHGLAASSEALLVVQALAQHFGTAQARLYYHANDLEVTAFRDVLAMWGVDEQFALEPRNTSTQLRTFLQELLANLRGIEIGQVDDATLDRLTRAVELLIAA